MNTTRFTIPLLLMASLPAQWTLQSPPGTPGPRAGHGMSADNIGNTFLFGGTASFNPLNDTWQWDGSTWTQLAPAASPGPRTMVELVYDVARNRHVLFGGWTTAISVGNASNQTWEFDGSTWFQAAPAASPPGVWKYAACYDLVRSRVVMYGGSTNGLPGATQTTWEYDGLTWTQVPGAGQPGPLENAAMCFDLGSNRTVMFGGINPAVGGNDTTWLFDGTAWTAASVTGPRPAARTGAKMVYDAVRGVCVLFGGMDAMTGAPFADTWEWSGVAWTQVPTTATGARAFGMAFDVTRRQVVRHGGFAGSATNAQTWLYGAQATSFGSGCAGSAGIPMLVSTNAPRLGSAWSMQLNNLNPAAPIAVMVLGLSAIGPVPLDGIGMPGCSAWISPDLLLTTLVSGGGGTWIGSLPSQPSLVGAHLYAQALSFDPGVNALGLTTTNALDGLLGH